MKKIKRLFCLLLAFIMIIPSTVFAEVSGGGDSTGGSTSVAPTGAGMMFRGVAYRIRLVEEPNFETGNMNLITVDSSTSTVTIKENNSVGIEGDGTDWYYFTGVDCGLATCVTAGEYQALSIDGSINTVTVHDKADLEAEIGIFATLDDLIKEGGAIDNYCDENLGAWKSFLGYTSTEPCLLVIEICYLLTDTVVNNPTLISRQQLYYTGSDDEKVMHGHTLISGIYTDWCWDTTNTGGLILKNYINQSVAPLGYSLNELGAKAKGYVVYGLEHIIIGNNSKSTANLVLEYQGAVGTNDSSKYNQSYSVVNGDITSASKTKYSDLLKWGTSSFTSADTISSYLNLDSNFKTGSNYYVAYSGITDFSVDSDTAISTIKSGLAIDTSKLTINWKATAVSAESTEKAFGSTYNVSGIKYDDATSYTKGTTPIIEAIEDNLGVDADSASSTKKTDYTIKENANYTLGKAAAKSEENTNEDNELIADTDMGLGVTFVVKHDSVKSNIATIKISNDVSVSWGTEKTYKSSESMSFTPNTEATLYMVVPYNKAVTDDATIKSELAGIYDSDAVIAKLNELCDNSKLTSSESIPSKINCGSNKGVGYIIYQVIIDEPVIEGNLELPAYLLNKYYNNVIQTSSTNAGRINKFKVNNILDNYTIAFKDVSADGTLVTYDTGDYLGKYLLKSNNVWDEMLRKNLTRDYATSITVDKSDTVVMDYAFNFTRSSVGDIRTLSGIHYSGLNIIDEKNILQLEFGVLPQTTLDATAIRDKNAYISGEFKENILIKAKNLTSSDKLLSMAFKPIKMNSSKKNELNYSFTKTAYKYQTNVLATGKNTKLIDGNVIITEGSAKASNNISEVDGYRLAYATNNNVSLSFYPEVRMAYKLISGNTYNTSSYVAAYTMGKVKRTAESSSLYLFRIEDMSTKPITGTSISDTAGIGNELTFVAGSDITMKADASGIGINLYGYSLDIIDKTADEEINLPDNSLTYRNIVASNEDVKSLWGNSNTTEQLRVSFENWVSTMTSADNYRANAILSVKSNKNAGYVDADSNKKSYIMSDLAFTKMNVANVEEDGVYPIEIEYGAINKDSVGYKALIQQIGDDYVVSYEQAEEIFEESGLYTSILEAIESCNDSFNTSGACSNSSWNIGNDTNWYDESTKTFVIRRYACEGNRLGEVILQDKLDYDIAKGVDDVEYANWYIDIYFANPVLGLSNNDLYNSDKSFGGISAAVNNQSIIAHNVLVHGAGFNVSDKTTEDFN